MNTELSQPISKKQIDKTRLDFVQLIRTMHDNGELNLDDILNSDDELIE